MISRVRGVFELAGVCLLIPAIVLHELTHYLVARPVARELRFDWRLSSIGIEVDWLPDAPDWRVRLAKVAPSIVGLSLCPLVVFVILRGDSVGIIPAIHLVALWAVYTKPSREDLSDPVR